MGQAMSFVEILREEIEKELRSELRSEVRSEVRAELRKELEAELKSTSATKASQASSQTTSHPHSYFETWLAANATQTTFSSAPKAKAAYGTSKRNDQPKQTLEEKTSHASSRAEQETTEVHVSLSSTEDICAAELLARHSGVDLSKLTEAKLKNAWRKAALKTHPDRFSQADQLTQERMSAHFRSLSEAYERLMCTIRSQAPHKQAA